MFAVLLIKMLKSSNLRYRKGRSCCKRK